MTAEHLLRLTAFSKPMSVKYAFATGVSRPMRFVGGLTRLVVSLPASSSASAIQIKSPCRLIENRISAACDGMSGWTMSGC